MSKQKPCLYYTPAWSYYQGSPFNIKDRHSTIPVLSSIVDISMDERGLPIFIIYRPLFQRIPSLLAEEK